MQNSFLFAHEQHWEVYQNSLPVHWRFVMFKECLLLCVSSLLTVGCAHASKPLTVPEGACKDSSEIPALMEVLRAETRNAETGSFAYSRNIRDGTKCLIRIGGPEAVQATNRLLQELAPVSRHEFFEAFLGQHSQDAILMLLSVLRRSSRYDDLGTDIVRGLAESCDPAAMPTLVTLLSSDRMDVRDEAAYNLAAHRYTRAVPELLEFIRSYPAHQGYPRALLETMKFLGDERVEDAKRFLISFAKLDEGLPYAEGNVFPVTEEALRSLARIDRSSALQTAQEILADTGCPDRKRSEAAQALREISEASAMCVRVAGAR